MVKSNVNKSDIHNSLNPSNTARINKATQHVQNLLLISYAKVERKALLDVLNRYLVTVNELANDTCSEEDTEDATVESVEPASMSRKLVCEVFYSVGTLCARC